MNTAEIYTAQLNVSKFYNDSTIDNLVTRLSCIGERSYYNTKTKTIDIECNRSASIDDDITIRREIKEWIRELQIDEENKNTIIDNIDIIFNITKLGYPNIEKHIINIFLY